MFSTLDGNVFFQTVEDNYPPMEHNFAVRSRILQLADDMLLDVVGLVVYVGQPQRERTYNGFVSPITPPHITRPLTHHDF